MDDAAMVVALQRGIPLCARPFEELSRELGCGEADLLACLARQRAVGTVRRFGAVFDTRRLGYRSALCAAAVSVEALDAAAAKLTPLAGVTHCYVREATSALRPGVPNLWFTLSYPTDIFPAMVDEVAARLGPYALHVLPATRRYKVDVVFGAATRAREEDVAEGDDLPPVTARDRAVIGALQGDTEARADFFAALAGRLGMKEWDLLSTLEIWRRKGRLKRIGLLLHHRNAGWSANGMCCWRVAGDTTAAGRALAARGEVTHCYERPEAPNFPYNLFAMVHARAAAEANAQFASLSAEVNRVAGAAVPAVMLLSTREYKKTSMTFFA
ncbi:MAG: hypothetical protein Q4G55_08820 [bacterium]|nr:hypothetical protein [bacterium]